ncbi:pilin/secretion family protein with methylation motif [Thermovibrio guaymasensis]|uniref:Pilin/secretion family protein with methylation motif n=1 Tax=Thermovibrio guaymasensis TaxID=240167 RepID=A0A420W9Q2_9BACT|nr:prepilin-type N-terminal cleavage/methylation domain-containing protein [Thermovibrio guaymasensis]RKQ64014.1 pilin/secretion family protein with methylation motif [Thermovibrio guaymasensis]
MSLEKREGFTIIETLIALAISTIVFLGLLATLLYAKKYNMSKACQYEAVRILHEKLEELAKMDYAEVTSELNNGATNCQDALRKNYITRYIGNLKVKYGLYYDINENTDLQLKRINLEVCWKYQGKFHHVSGTTVIRNKE